MADIKIGVPTINNKDRIQKYLKVLYQFHKLTDKEMELLTEIIYLYYQLRDKYDEAIADKLIFDSDNRSIVKKNVNNMSDPIFQNYLSNLRKKNVIKDGKLAKVFIPPSSNFNLIISFNETIDK